MAVSDVSICNMALGKLGANRINVLSENTVEAKACRDLYDLVRDDLLGSHPWNFAVKRTSLAQLSETPAFEFSYAFALPSDCLRIIQTSNNGESWVVEDNKFLSNYTDGQVKYISKVVEPGKFSPYFVQALATKLAMELSYTLTQSTTLKDTLAKEYASNLALARNYDAQEGTAVNQRVYADSWLNERY